ncbi:MAG: TIGR00269 family protein [Candidatus Pacearchaeota archaeon]|nr:TIGR00269 family protein [Candidatus Pacearchaeota archaeon]
MLKEKIYFLSCGRWLNASEFVKYFEKKVTKTIRKYELISKKDKVAIAFSGGKDSITLLYILNKFSKERGEGEQKLVALAIDEGIDNYRTELLEQGKKFCRELNVPIKIFSFKKEFGFNLGDKRIIKKIEKMKLSNCAVCSILKRWLLNKKAKELGFNVIATAHSLDDEAENILLNLMKGSPELLAKLGPRTGISEAKETKAFVQRVKPFYLCSTKEILLYAQLKKLPIPSKKIAICPLRGETWRIEIRKFLNEMDKKHIEVKNAIVNSFLKIMSLIKEKYKDIEFRKCKRCGFASSHEFCKTCLLLRELEKH